MLTYILKLVILLPLIGVMIWGSLKLAQRMQNGVGATRREARSVRVVETLMLSPTLKLAVLEFHGREILVSTSRNGLVRLAEAPARAKPSAEPNGGGSQGGDEARAFSADPFGSKVYDDPAPINAAPFARPLSQPPVQPSAQPSVQAQAAEQRSSLNPFARLMPDRRPSSDGSENR